MTQSSKSRRGKKRTTVKDLPVREKKLSKKDAKEIEGGAFLGGVSVAVADVNNDGKVDTIAGIRPAR